LRVIGRERRSYAVPANPDPALQQLAQGVFLARGVRIGSDISSQRPAIAVEIPEKLLDLFLCGILGEIPKPICLTAIALMVCSNSFLQAGFRVQEPRRNQDLGTNDASIASQPIRLIWAIAKRSWEPRDFRDFRGGVA